MPKLIKITGTAASEQITGVAAAEDIDAGAGNDTVVGGGGNDKIQGGAGDDLIGTDEGADELSGGPGADIFQFSGLGQFSANTQQERDHIMDFEAVDKIDLTPLGHITMAQVEVVTLHGQKADYRVLVHAGMELAIDVSGVMPTAANFILA